MNIPRWAHVINSGEGCLQCEILWLFLYFIEVLVLELISYYHMIFAGSAVPHIGEALITSALRTPHYYNVQRLDTHQRLRMYFLPNTAWHAGPRLQKRWRRGRSSADGLEPLASDSTHHLSTMWLTWLSNTLLDTTIITDVSPFIEALLGATWSRWAEELEERLDRGQTGRR